MTYACLTICSINYIGKARVLVESYKQHHPDHSFYLVVVDRKRPLEVPGVRLIWAEDLGIASFFQKAFTYDVIELNTNVKPAALAHTQSPNTRLVKTNNTTPIARLSVIGMTSRFLSFGYW